MTFDLQPRLHNEAVLLQPLRDEDFEALFAVASDPLIWEQHPSRERYQRDVFSNYFRGAIESGGAFAIFDNRDGELVGSSRYYDHDADRCRVSIGYTFIARSRWARNFNRSLKELMLDHAFKFVDNVTFQVGVNNWRSRKAMEKLGGVLVGEEAVAYHGEPVSPNVIYRINAADWASARRVS